VLSHLRQNLISHCPRFVVGLVASSEPRAVRSALHQQIGLCDPSSWLIAFLSSLLNYSIDQRPRVSTRNRKTRRIRINREGLLLLAKREWLQFYHH
jgi:hypothetical protein